MASLSKAQDMIPLFADGRAIKELMIVRKDHPLIAHDSIAALVNLSCHPELLKHFEDSPDFISSLVLTIILPKSVLADLCCMLLNNLTKSSEIVKLLIPSPDEN
ncbi:hypothetical protein HDV05_000237, partial [Chytridiales sp. JEL 0842]